MVTSTLMTRDQIEELSAIENTPTVRTTPFDEAVEYNARPEDVVTKSCRSKIWYRLF